MAASPPPPSCEIDAVSLVFAGSFNPAILQPQWLARHGLVGEAEAVAAKIGIIRPEVVSYQVGPFLITGNHDRVAFETSGAPQPLRDLAIGIFGILLETPVFAVGINRSMHFRMLIEDAWHAVGHALAPKAQWQGILEAPGTRSVTLKGTRPGHPESTLLITVEPSTRLPAGVFVSFNEHAEVSSVADALKRLDTHYEDACAHALDSALKIVRFGSAT